MNGDGFLEVLHFGLYPDESPKSWNSFFNKLIAKGLNPDDVKFVVSDCVRWLKKIVSHIFPNGRDAYFISLWMLGVKLRIIVPG